ncbi:restriction endonuclease subunit S [Parolsenella catena]|uniref:restriction endonuclease subunit S n=1 Tax=Parolsenella catena TaxID=2003188 RepID=UPI003A934DF9
MFGEPTTHCGRWPIVRLDSFTQVVTGNTPSRKIPEYYGEGIEWIKTDNIVNSAITASAEQLTEAGRAKARIAPAGSILMACIAGSVNSIGKVGLLDREAAFNQQINAIVPSCGVNSRFLLTMLTLSKDYLCSDVNQQLKGILNKTALSAKQFPLPPLDLQQQFANFASQVNKSKFAVQKALDELNATTKKILNQELGLGDV